jgi:hypothetical protein
LYQQRTESASGDGALALTLDSCCNRSQTGKAVRDGYVLWPGWIGDAMSAMFGWFLRNSWVKCLAQIAIYLACLPGVQGEFSAQAAEHEVTRGEPETVLRPVPWSEVWMTVRVGEVSVSTGAAKFELASVKGGAVVRLAKRQGGLEYGGLLAREEARKVLDLLQEEKAATLRTIPPRVVLGSLKQMEVRVGELGHGAVIHITPTVNTDTGDIDLKVVGPANEAGKNAQMSVTLAEGQTAELDQLVWQKDGADHHVFLMISAEALEQKSRPLGAKGRLERMMKKIIFPQLTLQGASLAQALSEVEKQYVDALFRDRSLLGEKILFGIRPMVAATSTAQISLDLHDVSMLEAVHYVTELGGTTWQGEGNAVIVNIISSEDEGMEMLTQSYKVPADFLKRLDPPAGDQSAQNILSNQGVSFPEGAKVTFNAKAGQLSVKATPANLRRVQALVDRASNESVGNNAWQARWLVIPKIDFQNLTLRKALDSIEEKSRAVDPGKRGAKATLAAGCLMERRLSFSAENLSALEAYYYAAKLTGHVVQVGKQGVVFDREGGIDGPRD